jgi:2'-5' RNA ligase
VWDEWESFRQLGHMVNHWDRPGWTEHTRSYHFFLTFEGAHELHELTRRCQTALAGIPTLDMVPRDLLHLTIEGVGFADRLFESEARAIAALVEEEFKDVPTFTLKVGPLTGSAGAVRFSVHPHEPLNEFRAGILQARGSGNSDFEGNAAKRNFVPHVSIAYCNAPTPVRNILPVVEGLRQLGHVQVSIDALKFVELRRIERTYVWEVIDSIELGPRKS